MLKTTYFRPSIHGWPFDNSFRFTFSIVGQDVDVTWGFCGGMCWTALKRFYAGTLLPRDLVKPNQGDALYNEIFLSQIESLPQNTVLGILLWQQSPDMGHTFNPYSSLGHDTQVQWNDTVKALLDQGKPVTLTVIETSNDFNPAHLSKNHRVVAYAYELTSLPKANKGEVRGDWNENIRKLVISIYDPNYHNDDDVKLTLYLGCDDSWIGMSHSHGDEVHGFFHDDVGRAFTHAGVPTNVAINRLDFESIVSSALYQYKLSFSWSCRFIPYFNILLNGTAWQYNLDAKQSLQPGDKDFKQSPAVAGSMDVLLRLPTQPQQTLVAVQLLGPEFFAQHLEGIIPPSVRGRPYLHNPGVNVVGSYGTTNITDAVFPDDIAVGIAKPTDADLASVDDDEFRYVFAKGPTRSTATPGHVHVMRFYTDYQIGNVNKPVKCDFSETSLASPTTRRASLTSQKGHQAASTTQAAILPLTGYTVFGGFNSPQDFNDDLSQKFKFTSLDRFGQTASGELKFYGRSIIQIVGVEECNLELSDEFMNAIHRRLYTRLPNLVGVRIPVGWDKTKIAGCIDGFTRSSQVRTAVDTILQRLLKEEALAEEIGKRQVGRLDSFRTDLISQMRSQPNVALKIGKANELLKIEAGKFNDMVLETFAVNALRLATQDRAIGSVIDGLVKVRGKGIEIIK